MNSLMRLIIFPNVFGYGVGLCIGILTNSPLAFLTSAVSAYALGYLIARKIWPPIKPVDYRPLIEAKMQELLSKPIDTSRIVTSRISAGSISTQELAPPECPREWVEWCDDNKS